MPGEPLPTDVVPGEPLPAGGVDGETLASGTGGELLPLAVGDGAGVEMNGVGARPG
jgi:hypothetical protein